MRFFPIFYLVLYSTVWAQEPLDSLPAVIRTQQQIIELQNSLIAAQQSSLTFERGLSQIYGYSLLSLFVFVVFALILCLIFEFAPDFIDRVLGRLAHIKKRFVSFINSKL